MNRNELDKSVTKYLILENNMVNGGLRIRNKFKVNTKENPLISIITVVYNGEKSIERTICSVVNQNYDNIEYIIIDGNSTDGTLDIIKKYDEKIDYWQSESDSGIYNAMNKGIQHITGEYCLFLNSGDYLVGYNVISSVLGELKDYDIIVGKEIMSNRTVISGISRKKLNIFTYMNGFIPHESTFIKSAILKKRNYNEQYRIISDYVFFFNELFINKSSYKTINNKITMFLLDGISSVNRELANKELNEFYHNSLPDYVLDVYLRNQRNTVIFDFMDSKFVILGLRICRKIKRIIKQKLDYYL